MSNEDMVRLKHMLDAALVFADPPFNIGYAYDKYI